MHHRGLILLLATFVLMPVCILTAAETDRGAENMTLDGGSRGPVPFPHHRHQTSLANDCDICHSVFPQEAGSIVRLKQAGTLKPKRDVMNRQCTKCHRTKKRAGEKSGPTGCSSCHQR